MKSILDLLPVALFFVGYLLNGMKTAIVFGTVGSVIQVGVSYIAYKKVETMAVVGLLAFVIFGGATIALDDMRFIKWKVSVVNWLLAIAFFLSGIVGKKVTLIERMMREKMQLDSKVYGKLNWMWVAFFSFIGTLNFFIMDQITEKQWATFKTFGVFGLTIAFVLIQGVFLMKYQKTSEAENKKIPAEGESK